eukprot:1161398-Pelagomonas_calceolata.AAC.7
MFACLSLQLVNRVTAISEISCVFRNNRDKLNEEKWRRSECCSCPSSVARNSWSIGLRAQVQCRLGAATLDAKYHPKTHLRSHPAVLLAMEDVKAVLIKLACRVHDMRTCGALPRERQVSLAQETLDIFSVVANRLGIWCLKADLEDLAFAVIHPEEHRALSEQVRTGVPVLACTVASTQLSAFISLPSTKCSACRHAPFLLLLLQVHNDICLRKIVATHHGCALLGESLPHKIVLASVTWRTEWKGWVPSGMIAMMQSGITLMVEHTEDDQRKACLHALQTAEVIVCVGRASLDPHPLPVSSCCLSVSTNLEGAA